MMPPRPGPIKASLKMLCKSSSTRKSYHPNAEIDILVGGGRLSIEMLVERMASLVN